MKMLSTAAKRGWSNEIMGDFHGASVLLGRGTGSSRPVVLIGEPGLTDG